MSVRSRLLALSLAGAGVLGTFAQRPTPVAAASFYSLPTAFCGVYARACGKDGVSIRNGRSRGRRTQRALHALVGVGCKSVPNADFESAVFAQEGHDRCKVTFKEPFAGTPFVSVGSRPDTPDVTTYSIPTIVEAGPSYVIVETARNDGGKLEIYHGGFELVAIGT